MIDPKKVKNEVQNNPYYTPVNKKYIDIDKMIQEGYKHQVENNKETAVEIWMIVWGKLKEAFQNENIKTVKEFDDILNGTQFISNWLTDLDNLLWELSNNTRKQHYRKKLCNYRIKFNTEALAYYKKVDKLCLENARRAIADSYYLLGDIDKAEELYKEFLEEDPTWGWGWIGWSDNYWLCKHENADYKKGEEILVKALEVKNLRDWGDVGDRLLELYSVSEQQHKEKMLEKELNEREKAQKRLKMNNSNRNQTVYKKIGRNEPCPCGSGQKYKRCCGK